MKKTLLSLTLLPLLLDAEEPLPDDLKLGLGAYFVGNYKSTLSVEDHRGVSIGLNLQDLLNMETKAASVYFDGYYRFTPHHRIEFGYKGVSSQGVSHSGDVYNPSDDIEIDLTGTVNSGLDINIARLVYTYSFYHNDKVELGVSIGLHRTAINLDLGASIGSSGGDLELVVAPPIPLLGVRFAYDIYPEWEVLFSYDLIALVANLNLPESPGITGISGRMSDMTLATEYRFFDNFSAGLALNTTNMNFKLKEEVVDLVIDNSVVGLAVYATFRY